MNPDAGGIYIHIPFCIRKCHYCDFYSITDTALLPAYLKALSREAVLRAASISPIPCDTIYIGGGTPSLIPPEDLASLLRIVHDAFDILPNPEITMEINPGTVEATTLADYRHAGVNRLSIGVQSFRNDMLRFLGRIHTASAARSAIEGAHKAGFDNLSLDLIYGLPEQSEHDWIVELNAASEYAPTHLSCYILACEPGTPLFHRRANGTYVPPDDRFTSRLYLKTLEESERLGYFQYEISNFSRSPETRSRHNQKYWHFDPYIGLGAGAHSFKNPRRWWNAKDVIGYVERLKQGRLPPAGKETLSREQQMIEAVYAGLRKREGIVFADFERRFDVAFNDAFSTGLCALADEGHLVISETACALSKTGMLYLDSIAAYLIDTTERSF